MSRNNKIECIGIVTYNRTELLKKLIDSINYNTEKLVIVNNGNELLTKEIFNNQNIDNIFIINNMSNLGLSYCRNLLLGNYLENYIIMMDDDICLGENDLENMYHLTIENLDLPSYILFGNTWFMSMNSKFLEKNGYFDENFYPVYFEDSDYVIRAFKNECNLIHVKNYTLTHAEKNLDSNLNNNTNLKQYICFFLEVYFRYKWGNIKSFNTEAIIEKFLDEDEDFKNSIYKNPFNNILVPNNYWKKSSSFRDKINNLLNKNYDKNI